MEDVDAFRKVVRCRDGKTLEDTTHTEEIKMPISESLWKIILESHHSRYKELVDLLIQKSERLELATKNGKLFQD